VLLALCDEESYLVKLLQFSYRQIDSWRDSRAARTGTGPNSNRHFPV
jgi:hypothetical protein